MKKRPILTVLSLLLAILTTSAAGTDKLIVDSMTIKGNMMAGMLQRLHISVENTGDQDYTSYWYLLNTQEGSTVSTVSQAVSISVGAGQVKLITADIPLPEGQNRIVLAADRQGQQAMASCLADIGPCRRLDIRGSFELGMMANEDNGRVLYGNDLRGTISVKNYDLPYYGTAQDLFDGQSGLFYRLETLGSSTPTTTGGATYSLGSQIETLQTISTDIAISGDFAENTPYVLYLSYDGPDGRVDIDSLLFTYRPGFCTYWTANGQVTPLPMTADQTLLIPADAIAVDLRNLYETDMAPSADASAANPNCLYYLNFFDNLPQGLPTTCNIIRNYQSPYIRLADQTDFYCPMAFKAEQVFYTLLFSDWSPWFSPAPSSTLVLPFNVSGVLLPDINTTDYDGLLTVYHYIGHVGDSLNIQKVSTGQMTAYEPYIIVNHAGTTRCIFYGEDTTLPITRQAIAKGDDLDFIGTTTSVAATPTTYRYFPETLSFSIIETDDLIPPFRAYIDGSRAEQLYERLWTGINIESALGSITDVEVQPAPQARGTYTLSGVRTAEGRQLPKGIYIKDGRKMMVK